jgi:hypothetical protein
VSHRSPWNATAELIQILAATIQHKRCRSKHGNGFDACLHKALQRQSFASTADRHGRCCLLLP